MAAGSVSTPTRTTTTTTPPSRASKPSPSKPESSTAESKPKTSDRVRDAEGVFITSQMPGIKNAAAIAQAVTGERDISGPEAGRAVLRAMHGDLRTTGSRTTKEIRRSGTHVGTRDARQALLLAERADLAKAYAKGPGGVNAAELDKQMNQISSDLRASRGMNAVADTLHVLGADDYHVGVLEDEERVRVVADDKLAGSAGYDHDTHSIVVSQSLADTAAKAADALYRQGILDSRGRIVQGREDDLDASMHGDQLIKVGTLIAYHEQKHAEQDFIGGLGGFVEGAAPAVTELMEKHQLVESIAATQGMHDIPTWAATDDAWAIEQLRVHGEEYDAYLAQEQADIAFGASVKVQLVTDANGDPLERGQAVENIIDMERGRALRHGPDAGWVRDDVLKELMSDAGTDPAQVPWDPAAIAGHGATMLGETPGWKRPGWKRPGWKRPGSLIE